MSHKAPPTGRVKCRMLLCVCVTCNHAVGSVPMKGHHHTKPHDAAAVTRAHLCTRTINRAAASMEAQKHTRISSRHPALRIHAKHSAGSQIPTNSYTVYAQKATHLYARCHWHIVQCSLHAAMIQGCQLQHASPAQHCCKQFATLPPSSPKLTQALRPL